MLVIELDEDEIFNNVTQTFTKIEARTLHFEHSLRSLREWEAYYKKPFLSEEKRTTEETIYYIKCMCLDGDDLGLEVFYSMANKPENAKKIQEYINDPHTATTIKNDDNQKKNKEVLTAELIHYYMIAMQIPESYENWHLNQLLVLIQVCSIKNQPPKKMSKAEIYARNAKLNAERKAKFNSKG